MKLLRSFLLFLRNTIGCITNPYVIYRHLSEEKHADVWQTFYIILLALGYFAFASLLRTGVRNPYLLTIRFNSLLLASAIGFAGMVSVIFFLGRLVAGRTRWPVLITLWSYTLLPTLVWFFATSILYLFLPPPRTVSIPGKTYSIIFVSFSLALAAWKLILYYLTLRFGLRIDFWKITGITIIIAPFVAGYSWIMYRMGIFRIPFL